MAAWAGWLIAAGGLAVVELLTLAVVAGLLSAAARVPPHSRRPSAVICRFRLSHSVR